MHHALKPRGVVTVLQHEWLWSATDEEAHHKSRYSRFELLAKLAAAGFEILHWTSFVSTLLLILIVQRRAKRGADNSLDSELRISPPINVLCSGGMRVDELLIRSGLSLGGSLLAIAFKK